MYLFYIGESLQTVDLRLYEMKIVEMQAHLHCITAKFFFFLGNHV